ncbi:MAG: hypothetical protein ACREPQ_14125 [Rhodanobacter sp.]
MLHVRIRETQFQDDQRALLLAIFRLCRQAEIKGGEGNFGIADGRSATISHDDALVLNQLIQEEIELLGRSPSLPFRIENLAGAMDRYLTDVTQGVDVTVGSLNPAQQVLVQTLTTCQAMARIDGDACRIAFGVPAFESRRLAALPSIAVPYLAGQTRLKLAPAFRTAVGILYRERMLRGSPVQKELALYSALLGCVPLESSV